MKYTKIKSDEQYNEYCELHEAFTLKNYDKHIDEIELLEILIEEYEERSIDAPEEMSPVEIIIYLLEENKLTKSQLAKDIGVSRQLITDIINYRRNISKSMVNKLAKHFAISPAALSKAYSLKNIKQSA